MQLHLNLSTSGKTWEEKVSIFRDYQYQYIYHFYNGLSRDLGGGDTFYGGATSTVDSIKGKGTMVAIGDRWMQKRPQGINFGMMVRGRLFEEN